MVNKSSSILDYQQDSLCSDIWLDHGQMRPAIKAFIISMVQQFFDDENIRGCDKWIIDYLVGSSLATYFYKNDSDLDVKVVIDIDDFKRSNPIYENLPSEDILNDLIKLGRSSLWLTSFIPDTHHPLDVYFYSREEASSINLLKYDSLYSITQDVWIKEPKKLPKGITTDYIIQQAKMKTDNFMAKLDKDIVTAKRDSIDLLLLFDYLKTLDSTEIKSFVQYINHLYQNVDFDLAQLIKDREVIKQLRKDAFSKDTLASEFEQVMQSFNYSDENIMFKLLQRYGYMRILKEIHELYSRRGLTKDTIKDFIVALSR